MESNFGLLLVLCSEGEAQDRVPEPCGSLSCWLQGEGVTAQRWQRGSVEVAEWGHKPAEEEERKSWYLSLLLFSL